MKETPMMSQYMAIKRQYPDKIVLFRMGDFYETFGKDAEIASKVLNITLTRRSKEMDAALLAGFPHHAIDQYLPKLINGGYSAVIVDQLEDPKNAVGVVKRGVTRIVTPGTIDSQLQDIKNLYILSIYRNKNTAGVAICDITAGHLKTTQFAYSKQTLEGVINSFEPAEVLIFASEKEIAFPNIPVQIIDRKYEDVEISQRYLKNHFKVKNLDALGIEKMKAAQIALAMVLDYVTETQKIEPYHLKKVEVFKHDGTMMLDSATIRNLELVTSSVAGMSLFDILNKCKTSMGKRLLYSIIINPLINKKSIDERLDQVERYIKDYEYTLELRNLLGNITDIERITGKIGLNRATARDLKALQYSLTTIKQIANLKNFVKELDEVIDFIDKTIVDNPPQHITEGHVIKDGYSKEIDDLRNIAGHSKNWMNDFIVEERKKTGISSLKAGFNKVFGYYIEVTKTHKEKVPDYYIRKQTLVNCERFITEELKQKEDIIVNAEERLATLEFDIFQQLRNKLIVYLSKIQKLSLEVAEIDVFSDFAFIAVSYNYNKPVIYEAGENSGLIKIADGRHPVIERYSSEEFVPNDAVLDSNTSRVVILTGPNMSGKSTYIRQVAIIVLMAQIGCYVPATSLELSIVDRIFTRVGAYDDLSRGRSTFMVEMEEASNIVNNATQNSLVILDEVGRGTSTYDGVSIAWALADYLANEIKCRTLFATHYHELLKLADNPGNGIMNYNVQVDEDEEKDQVVFLRKIVPGGTDRSYGIYVAKLAGLPERIITQAREILRGFEQESMFSIKNNNISNSADLTRKEELKAKAEAGEENPYPTNLFGGLNNGIITDIEKLDLDKLSPLEALNKISDWKKRLGSN